MEELFVPIYVLLILLAPIVLFVWQFRRVHRGLCSRIRGAVLYAVYSAVPTLFFVGIFLALVGVEELTNTSLIGEGYARSLMIVSIGGGAIVVLGTIVFLIVVAFIKKKAI